MTHSDNGPGILFPPPLNYFIGFLFAYAMNRFYPIPMVGPPLSIVLALIAVTPSAVLGLWSLLEFWRARTNFLPHKPSSSLVIVGPYRVTRNPMYLSLALLYVSFGFLLSIAWTFIILPMVIFIMNVYVIRREESYLESRFGEQYRAYTQQVHRWL
ncbi:MAG: isoprenylcysteine carboxylmethyltransferase family protein [Deltaproteobacteria bacterium]|nr:isoprenylcysteine carboxylmethyltransferase family protein [Deltaproteobacteria bacterium]